MNVCLPNDISLLPWLPLSTSLKGRLVFGTRLVDYDNANLCTAVKHTLGAASAIVLRKPLWGHVRLRAQAWDTSTWPGQGCTSKRGPLRNEDMQSLFSW